MSVSPRNPFDNNENNRFPLLSNGSSRFRNLTFVAVLIVIAALSYYLFTDGAGATLPTVSDENHPQNKLAKNGGKPSALDTLNGYKPYYILAFAEGAKAAVWVFSFKPDGKTYLTILNPLTKTINYHGLYPYSDCSIDKILIQDCLINDVGLLGNKLWLSLDEKNLLYAFDVHTGKVIYDAKIMVEKYGNIADGILNLRSYGFERIEFYNKSGEQISFYPYSEKLEIRGSRTLNSKFTGSLVQFMVKDKAGKSNVYVTDAKLDNVEGRIYFGWDYSDCESYEPGGYNTRYINSVKKLSRTLINPIKMAENGEVAIFIHSKEFGNNDVRFAEAIDRNGNSLWKDSADLYNLINSSNSFATKFNPQYSGNIAVFFNPGNMTTSGIDFRSGKVLWNLNYESIYKLVQTK